MIIYGWGHVTKKHHGQVKDSYCPICRNEDDLQLCVVRTWFTLFFIPVIPYKTLHTIHCRHCNNHFKLTKEKYRNLKEAGGSVNSEQNQYAGKTETQIAYLKQMEEAKQARNE